MSLSSRQVDNTPPPIITSELHPYQYLTDTTSYRYYNHWFFRGLDAVGRLLSFERNKPATSFDAKDWIGFTLVWGTGGVLGIAGALLRFIASFGQDDFKIQTFKKEEKEEKEEKEKQEINANSLRIYTLNTALMPRFPFSKSSVVNGSFLGPNANRATGIAEHILATHQEVTLDAIHLQEVFDPEAERILIDKLKGTFPYVVSRIGASSALKPSVSSGLVSLYRHPITSAKLVRYENEMIGHETLANKGAMVVKITKKDQVYLCYNTHLHGGPGIFKKIAEWWGGNTRLRRSRQLLKLHAALKEMAEDTTGGTPNYVVGSGDFNLHAENQRKKESRSSGKSYATVNMTGDDYNAKSVNWRRQHPRKGKVKFLGYKKFTDSQNIGYLEEGNSYRREPINFYYEEYEKYKKSIESVGTDYSKKNFVNYRNQQAQQLKKISGTTLSKKECRRIKHEAAVEAKTKTERTGLVNEGQLFDHIYAGEVSQLSAKKYKPATDGPAELKQVIVQPGDGSFSDHLAIVGFFSIKEKAREKAAELSLALTKDQPASIPETSFSSTCEEYESLKGTHSP